MKETKENLLQQLGCIQKKIGSIEAAERRAINKPLLGKCFKYHNSYSGSQRWWLYICITKADSCGLESMQFQTDCHGKVEFEPGRHHYNISDYTPITRAEFLAAQRKALAYVKRLLANRREST